MRMMPRSLLVSSALAVLGTSCQSDKVSSISKSIRVSPKTVSMLGGQSVDIQVTITGFPTGTAFACRVVPSSAGTVVGDASKCRLTVSTPAMPGTLMIAQIETFADTATVVIPAR
jgi:hypothetical protein